MLEDGLIVTYGANHLEKRSGRTGELVRDLGRLLSASLVLEGEDDDGMISHAHAHAHGHGHAHGRERETNDGGFTAYDVDAYEGDVALALGDGVVTITF